MIVNIERAEMALTPQGLSEVVTKLHLKSDLSVVTISFETTEVVQNSLTQSFVERDFEVQALSQGIARIVVLVVLRVSTIFLRTPVPLFFIKIFHVWPWSYP